MGNLRFDDNETLKTAVRAFFAAEGIELAALHGVVDRKLAYAEFASPAVAAAALEQCRGKKIGDSSCKFDVCQKLPNFSNKPAKRERRPPHRVALSGSAWQAALRCACSDCQGRGSLGRLRASRGGTLADSHCLPLSTDRLTG